MIILCLEGVHGAGKTHVLNKCKQAGFAVLDEGFMTIPTLPKSGGISGLSMNMGSPMKAPPLSPIAPSAACTSSIAASPQRISPQSPPPKQQVLTSSSTGTALSPQSLVMETLWVAKWFERLLMLQQLEDASNPKHIYVADRSPYSAVFYSQENKGHHLRPLITQMIDDLRAVNIFIYTLYVRVTPDKIWSRVCSRLVNEPQRKQFNEHKREWLNHVFSLYEGFKNEKGQLLWDYIVHNEIDNDDQVLHRIMQDVSHKVPEIHSILPSLVSYSSAAASPSKTAQPSSMGMSSHVQLNSFNKEWKKKKRNYVKDCK